MTESHSHPFEPRLRGASDSCLLHADQLTGVPLMSLPDVEEHTESYIAIKHGDSSFRGIPTGALGGILSVLSCGMALVRFSQGNTVDGLELLLIAVAIFLIPFLWEVLRPLPLPLVINRRTRELYYEQDGKLYHTPWDGIAAAAYEFATVGLHYGRMRHAALEVLMHRYDHPQERVIVPLGLPIGKRLSMQQGFWEYLRAFMDNGPWFDERGRHSESPEFNLSLVINKRRTSLSLDWMLLKEEYKANNGKNFLSATRFLLLLSGPLMFPIEVIQYFTYDVAKRRSHRQWPELVRERLRPDGPTTRLIDLEREQGPNV
ncbi:hypothetical protein A9C11_15805 [Pseudomonas citronellolis]|uniref:Uncharacterized protein n=1 Tax=Pseudomonas citronellolis TaxID=53408 RepID=A0A1A9KCU7_9PSED|nr:hypothetical protein [Pseudomonas citronellolis]ANI15352.1 hypothetical protein A9C11_15805 [Pseudomonas citronellolis]